MDILADGTATADGTAVAPDSTPTPAGLAAPNTAAPAPDAAPTQAPVRGTYLLVEDIDYLIRTGRSRQVLAIRWTC